MFSSVIIQVAFGLQLLFAAGDPAPAVVGQAAGQITAKTATDRAETRVTATTNELNKQLAAKKSLDKKRSAQLVGLDKLKKQRASWNRDRKIRSKKAEADATGKKLAKLAKEIRRLKTLLSQQRATLVAAIDKEQATNPDSVRNAALITLRTRTASKLPHKRKARKIVLPPDRLDQLADPEELEEQAALLAAAEKQLLREQRKLENREDRFTKMAKLREQARRAGELDQFEPSGVRRTTGRVNDPNKAAGRGDNESAGTQADPSPDDDGQGGLGDSPPPGEPGAGDPDFGGFAESSVVLSDVVDSTTVDALRRAERSSNPKTKASAARSARRQVEDKLKRVRALRKKMLDRARKLRK